MKNWTTQGIRRIVLHTYGHKGHIFVLDWDNFFFYSIKKWDEKRPSVENSLCFFLVSAVKTQTSMFLMTKMFLIFLNWKPNVMLLFMFFKVQYITFKDRWQEGAFDQVRSSNHQVCGPAHTVHLSDVEPHEQVDSDSRFHPALTGFYTTSLPSIGGWHTLQACGFPLWAHGEGVGTRAGPCAYQVALLFTLWQPWDQCVQCFTLGKKHMDEHV